MTYEEELEPYYRRCEFHYERCKKIVSEESFICNFLFGDYFYRLIASLNPDMPVIVIYKFLEKERADYVAALNEM